MFSMIVKDGLKEYLSIRKKQADKDDDNLDLNIDEPRFWCFVLVDSIRPNVQRQKVVFWLIVRFENDLLRCVCVWNPKVPYWWLMDQFCTIRGASKSVNLLGYFPCQLVVLGKLNS